jgi:hypothetical protein
LECGGLTPLSLRERNKSGVTSPHSRCHGGAQSIKTAHESVRRESYPPIPGRRPCRDSKLCVVKTCNQRRRRWLRVKRRRTQVVQKPLNRCGRPGGVQVNLSCTPTLPFHRSNPDNHAHPCNPYRPQCLRKCEVFAKTHKITSLRSNSYYET